MSTFLSQLINQGFWTSTHTRIIRSACLSFIKSVACWTFRDPFASSKLSLSLPLRSKRRSPLNSRLNLISNVSSLKFDDLSVTFLTLTVMAYNAHLRTWTLLYMKYLCSKFQVNMFNRCWLMYEWLGQTDARADKSYKGVSLIKKEACIHDCLLVGKLSCGRTDISISQSSFTP